MLVAKSPLLFKKLMAGTVLLAYIIGPKSCIDIAAATKQDSFSANLTFAHMCCIALINHIVQRFLHFLQFTYGI